MLHRTMLIAAFTPIFGCSLLAAMQSSTPHFDVDLITNFTRYLVPTQQCIIFACHHQALMNITIALQECNQLVQPIHLATNFTLATILTRSNHARTTVLVDCACPDAHQLLHEASLLRYFNKTYQWLLWAPNPATSGSIEKLLPIQLPFLGPDAQITYVNRSTSGDGFTLWDIHSKGRHLQSPLEVQLAAMSTSNGTRKLHHDILYLQGIHYRDQFRGLCLRGASVIDQENITTNEQIERILSQPGKDAGVSAFSKYHYALLDILRERLNFTVNFRNARGWASRLGNTSFRLGFLGIIKRNEADIGASGAFNRINRFAEFDTIHQGWKFETAFLYRFTPDLDTQAKSGNFLAPFEMQVWLFACSTLFAVNLVWYLVERMQHRLLQLRLRSDEISLMSIILKTTAAVCQQGMEHTPPGFASSSIIMTTFLFALVMYNYYTSSVVGGLLSNTVQGPSTVKEIIASPLKLSFEDIGYYKVLFRENKSPIITDLINKKLLIPRDRKDLPIYAHIEDAILHLQNGHFAFHCETVDAYPIIAKSFDANEICDLRVVSGLLDTELMNFILTKNSQYTEIFRIVMNRAREVGLVSKLLLERRANKPSCQALYIVYPVSFSGVMSAFITLFAGSAIACATLLVELIVKRLCRNE